MNSDRDALIAGIAADPDNDLRRLVVADWLEENRWAAWDSGPREMTLPGGEPIQDVRRFLHLG